MELFILGGLNLNEFEIQISLDSGLLQIRIKELYIVRYSWHFFLFENLHLSEFIIWLIMLIVHSKNGIYYFKFCIIIRGDTWRVRKFCAILLLIIGFQSI